MKLSYTFIWSMTLFLISCTTNGASDNPNIESIYVSNNQLYFKGEITESSVKHTFTAINNYKGIIQTMTVNSLGGDILPAMKLGNWIFDNNIQLIVNRFCASSCANYFFTAAKSVHINKNSLVLWHEGATQKNFLENAHTPKELEDINDKIKIEKQFFEKIGVKEEITVYGQLKDFSIMKNTPDCFAADAKGVLQGWTYSIEDLKKFGVDSITSDNISPPVAVDGYLMGCLIKVDS